MLVLIPIVIFIIIFVIIFIIIFLKYPSNFSIINNFDYIFFFMHNAGIYSNYCMYMFLSFSLGVGVMKTRLSRKLLNKKTCYGI